MWYHWIIFEYLQIGFPFFFFVSRFFNLDYLISKLQFFLLQYAGIRIGPVVKKDVMKASIMLEHDSQWVDDRFF